jgi:hypothetical protein
MRRFPQPLEEATGGVRFAGWRPARSAAISPILADPSALCSIFLTGRVPPPSLARSSERLPGDNKIHRSKFLLPVILI